ncbi:MAG TPA: 50S ribosomal protein L9 [Mycobacteriales bacterium]|nr:50S ribosomal protein L9 [Mycobacteriales bacterium]
MKLILTRDVPGVGAPGDIVEVRDGYGRNFLVPRGDAMLWTRGAETQVSSIRRGREVREIADRGQAQAVADGLAALEVSLPTRAGQGGRLFGSVTAADIVQAVQSAGGPVLDKRRIDIASPIKTVGSHTVEVRLHPQVTVQLSIDVVAAS